MNSIEEAAEAIVDEMKLSQNFMNSHIRLFINDSSFEKAIERSFSQNDIIFQNDVIQFYVADYRIQFISKVDRMSNAVERGPGIQKKISYRRYTPPA